MRMRTAGEGNRGRADPSTQQSTWCSSAVASVFLNTDTDPGGGPDVVVIMFCSWCKTRSRPRATATRLAANIKQNYIKQSKIVVNSTTTRFRQKRQHPLVAK